MDLSDNPMTALLQMRARRERTSVRSLVPFCLAMGLLSLLFSPSTDSQAALGPYLSVHLGLTVVLVPCLLASSNSAFLLGLRRGGCIDEMLGTCTPAGSLVDGAVGYTLRDVVRSGLLLLGPLDALAMHLVGFRDALAVAVLWPLVLLAATVAAAYCVQLVPAWAAVGKSAFPYEAVPALVLVGGAGVATLALAGGVAASAETAGATLLVGLLLTAGLARALGLLGLRWADRLRRQLATWVEGLRMRGAGRSHSFYRSWVEEPVSWREFSRAGGLSGFLSLHWSGLLGATLILLHQPVVEVFVLLNLWRAGATAVDLVCRERENRTLDSVLQTGMRASSFVRGTIDAAALPRMAECCCLLGLSLVGASEFDSQRLFLLSVLSLLGPWASALGGTWAATVGDTRSASQAMLMGFFLLWLTGSCCVFPLVYGLTFLFGVWDFPRLLVQPYLDLNTLLEPLAWSLGFLAIPALPWLLHPNLLDLAHRDGGFSN